MSDHPDIFSKVRAMPGTLDELIPDYVHFKTHSYKLHCEKDKRIEALENQMEEFRKQLKYQIAEGKEEKKAKGNL